MTNDKVLGAVEATKCKDLPKIGLRDEQRKNKTNFGFIGIIATILLSTILADVVRQERYSSSSGSHGFFKEMSWGAEVFVSLDDLERIVTETENMSYSLGMAHVEQQLHAMNVSTDLERSTQENIDAGKNCFIRSQQGHPYGICFGKNQEDVIAAYSKTYIATDIGDTNSVLSRTAVLAKRLSPSDEGPQMYNGFLKSSCRIVADPSKWRVGSCAELTNEGTCANVDMYLSIRSANTKENHMTFTMLEETGSIAVFLVANANDDRLLSDITEQAIVSDVVSGLQVVDATDSLKPVNPEHSRLVYMNRESLSEYTYKKGYGRIMILLQLVLLFLLSSAMGNWQCYCQSTTYGITSDIVGRLNIAMRLGSSSIILLQMMYYGVVVDVPLVYLLLFKNLDSNQGQWLILFSFFTYITLCIVLVTLSVWRLKTANHVVDDRTHKISTVISFFVFTSICIIYHFVIIDARDPYTGLTCTSSDTSCGYGCCDLRDFIWNYDSLLVLIWFILMRIHGSIIAKFAAKSYVPDSIEDENITSFERHCTGLPLKELYSDNHLLVRVVDGVRCVTPYGYTWCGFVRVSDKCIIRTKDYWIWYWVRFMPESRLRGKNLSIVYWKLSPGPNGNIDTLSPPMRATNKAFWSLAKEPNTCYSVNLC